MRPLSAAGSFTLLSIACLTIMVGCVIVPGLPSIAAQLKVESSASWLVTLPSLGVVVFGPLAARLMTSLGLFRALLVGLFSYGLLGVTGAFLAQPLLLFTDRFLLGGATAVVMSAGTGLLSHFFEGEQRLKMIARQGMSIELGGVIFLFIGGLLASAGWRWPFALYLFAWLFMVMQWLFVPRPAEAEAVTDPQISATSQRLPDVLKPVYTAALLSMICFFTAVIILPGALKTLHYSEAETGYILSFISLIAVAAAWAMPNVVRHAGTPLTLLFAFIAYGVALLDFAFSSTLLPLTAGAVLMGIGFGLSVPLVNHSVVEQSSVAQRGRNLAWLSMAIFSGQFLSSFMAWLPGNATGIFTGAAAVAFFSAVMLCGWQKRLHQENQESDAPL